MQKENELLDKIDSYAVQSGVAFYCWEMLTSSLPKTGETQWPEGGQTTDRNLCHMCEPSTPASSSMDLEELDSIANPMNGHERERTDTWVKGLGF